MQEAIDLNPTPPPRGLNIGDIYYCLFRHKWKIMVMSLAGIVAAAVAYLLHPPVYASEARLFVRYVLDSKPSVEPGTGNSQVLSPDNGGESIMDSEIEILTSMDLAEKVVDALGAGKILGKADGGINRTEAAIYVHKHITAESAKRSSVIRLTFMHPDPRIPQPALRHLIDAYRQKHVEIHRALGIFDDFLTQQTDQMRSRLSQTEDELRKVKQKANVASVEESKQAYHEQAHKIGEEILKAEAELAERKAALAELRKLAGAQSQVTAFVAPKTEAPADIIDEYKRFSVRLDSLWKRYQELTVQFTAENSQVKTLHNEITQAEKQKQELEQKYPGLERVGLPALAAFPGGPAAPGVLLDLSGEASRAKGLEAKLKALTNQFERVRSEAATLEELESTITQLQRRRDLQETQYWRYSAGLEQARLDESLGAAKTANISQVEAPSPPLPENKKLKKLLLMLLVGGFGSGLALALACDWFLDETLRRPTEIEACLRLPLLLSIPDTKHNGHRLGAAGGAGRHEQGNRSEKSEADLPNASKANLQVAPWDPRHAMQQYFESLRDRLITYFEVRNMTHHPKLIAVTGCSRGAGTTTLAIGLAASLSETGEGNVLLVDMNSAQGAVHPFYKGEPHCDLAGVLEQHKRESALVQSNLYLATEASQNGTLPRALPKRFLHLVPKLKASDYDYIIFDMPSITPTSFTPRLAGYMDMVLLVLESEKTNRDIAKRACDLLAESKATVSTVLNKRRNYVPEWLHHEW